MTLPQNELCQICKNSRRSICFVEKQRNIDMQQVVELVNQSVKEATLQPIGSMEKNALCMFLSGLDEAERLFALKRKTLPSTQHYDVYKKLKRTFDDLPRDKTEITEQTYEYIKTQFTQERKLITEEAFEFFFDLAMLGTKLKSKYRQHEGTKKVIKVLKQFFEYDDTKIPLQEDEVIEKLKNEYLKSLPLPQLSTSSIQLQIKATPEAMKMLERFIQEKNLNVSIEDN